MTNSAYRFFSFVFFLSFSLIFSPDSVFADQTATLLPTSDGTYLQWSPSTGSTHYNLVDEAACNGKTDYVTGVSGNRDSYNLNISSVPNGSQITQIDITPCASRASGGGSGSSVLNVFYRLNGVNSADTGAYSLSGTTPVGLGTTSYTALTPIKAATTALQLGGVFSGNKSARLGRIAAVITYTPLASPSGLTGTPDSTPAAILNWTDNSTIETSTLIDRSTDGVFFTLRGTVGANITTFTDVNLTSGLTYYYKVRSSNSGGASSSSNTVSVTAP